MGAQNKVMGVRSKERKIKEMEFGFDLVKTQPNFFWAFE
jgi:hypothetical protein